MNKIKTMPVYLGRGKRTTIHLKSNKVRATNKTYFNGYLMTFTDTQGKLAVFEVIKFIDFFGFKSDVGDKWLAVTRSGKELYCFPSSPTLLDLRLAILNMLLN